MKIYKFRFLILGVIMAVALGFYLPSGEEETKKDKVILNLVYNILNSAHFSPQDINDDFSEEVFTHYIETLDYSKRFLLKEDIEKLESFKTKIDNEIKNSELDFFEAAYKAYDHRFNQTTAYYQQILATPFDFTINETLETDDEKLEFAETEAEIKDRWRKYLKHRVLMRIEERLDDQEVALEKNDTTMEQKEFAEIEADARERELEMHNDWFETLRDLERIDWLGMYINTITTIYDPHTQYFPPERQEDFQISMSGQLEGIGAQLEQKGDYVVISRIIPGSACWKQGDLEVGDKILKVAQENETDEEAVDVVGMKVRKVVNYIRGPKGTEVRLTVQKLDGSKMLIPIVRDVVELEATFAKSAVIGEGDNKIGYIKLPKFYVDFYNESNRNCAEDVKLEIEKLKKENINGIILDLRNNGGGSLQGVIDIVGLFIEEGPVVQVKTPGRDPQVLEDKDKGISYDGPLVVMVNQFSASASEIFAAAIQDYKRGIIVGSKSTFGKGTVQNMLDMDRRVNFSFNDVKPLGALKLTIQKYYRINGGTPQLRGVQPEVILPDNYTYIEYGEKEQEFALPYDEIEAAKYDTWKKGKNNFEEVIESSEERISDNAKFVLIDEYAQWLKEQREETEVNLNFAAYHKYRQETKEKNKRFENMRNSDHDLVLNTIKADDNEWNASEDKIKEKEQWFKALSNDLYLGEAFQVALDIK